MGATGEGHSSESQGITGRHVEQAGASDVGGRRSGRNEFRRLTGPRYVQDRCRDAELPKELSNHTARHTLAVHLLRRTGNLRQVQKQLGHASPVTTANMYADVAFEDMQAGLNGLYE